MTEKELHNLLDELLMLPHEQQWVEFKMNAGSITNEYEGKNSSKWQKLGISLDVFRRFIRQK